MFREFQFAMEAAAAAVEHKHQLFISF